MIISASRRTDIPAFYAEWFMNRIKDGYVLTVNPYNTHQTRRIDLSPELVDCIVFWTRNPAPLMPYLNSLDDMGHKYYFQYTITGYPRHIEKSVPNPHRAIETFVKLSSIIGRDRVIWRYDPILLSKQIPYDEHLRLFEKIATALSSATGKVVISIVDSYKKTVRNLNSAGLDISASHNEAIKISCEMKRIADALGLSIFSCAEEFDLSSSGVLPGKCIDDKLIQTLTGKSISIDKDKTQREQCGCIKSIDIGSYNTCLHGCAYCYATFNGEMAAKNFENHDPKSPFLIRRKEEIIANPQDSLF